MLSNIFNLWLSDKVNGIDFFFLLVKISLFVFFILVGLFPGKCGYLMMNLYLIILRKKPHLNDFMYLGRIMGNVNGVPLVEPKQLYPQVKRSTKFGVDM